MEQNQPGPAIAEPGQAEIIVEILARLEEQGRQTQDLVRSLVTLLLPKKGGRDGPTLEELLAAMLAQQQQLIAIAEATQASVDHLGSTLPDAVAQALGSRSARPC